MPHQGLTGCSLAVQVQVQMQVQVQVDAIVHQLFPVQPSKECCKSDVVAPSHLPCAPELILSERPRHHQVLVELPQLPGCSTGRIPKAQQLRGMPTTPPAGATHPDDNAASGLEYVWRAHHQAQLEALQLPRNPRSEGPSPMISSFLYPTHKKKRQTHGSVCRSCCRFLSSSGSTLWSGGKGALMAGPPPAEGEEAAPGAPRALGAGDGGTPPADVCGGVAAAPEGEGWDWASDCSCGCVLF